MDMWGGFVSLAGLVVSTIGLAFAIRVALQARTAARAAETASVEARQSIRGRLSVVDLRNAIGVIERIKTVHSDEQLRYGLEHYHYLRMILGDIQGAVPREDWFEMRETHIPNLIGLENRVAATVATGGQIEGLDDFYPALNSIQDALVRLASSMMFPEDTVGE